MDWLIETAMSKMKTKKCVVVLNVLDTEDLKPKHAAEKRASDGILKHLKRMIIRQNSTPMRVWKIISAEIRV